jgi:hypothetical protein
MRQIVVAGALVLIVASPLAAPVGASVGPIPLRCDRACLEKDSERGVVWAHCVFDHGTVNSGVLADGTKHSYAGFNARAASW